MENLRPAAETQEPIVRSLDWEDRRRRLSLDTAGVSHRGRRRLNQDQHLIADLLSARRRDGAGSDHGNLQSRAEEMLLVVADGMGGHPCGEVASLLAVRVLVKELLAGPAAVDDPLAKLDAAVRCADEALHRAGARRSDLATMGTTLTAAWWLPPMLFFAHVGDSRLYLLRDGRLARLTRDHTLAAKLLAGGIDRDRTHDVLHVLTQALGGAQKGVDPDEGVRRLQAGDALLLCTDGLGRGVTDAEIARALERADSAHTVAVALLEGALATDDGDNITAVVARVLPTARRGEGDERRGGSQEVVP